MNTIINSIGNESMVSTRLNKVCVCCNAELSSNDAINIELTDDSICINCATDFESEYSLCKECGDACLTENMWTIDTGDEFERICRFCMDYEKYCVCNSCNNGFRVEDCHRLHEDEHAVDRYICDVCAEEWGYLVCDKCGIYFDPAREGQVFRNEFGEVEAAFCYEHANNELGKAHHHDYKPYKTIFHSGDNERTKLYFGTELECDADFEVEQLDEITVNNYIISLVNGLYKLTDNENNFYMKMDGSLTYGIECVSHPYTVNEFMKKYPIEEMCEMMNKYLFTNPKGTAGFHVHMSKAFADGNPDFLGGKMAGTINKYQNEIPSIAHRNFNGYCYCPDVVLTADDTEEDVIAKAQSCKKHYCAMNLENSSTFELRIFKGTTDASLIKAYVQFSYMLINYCKTHSVKDIVNGSYSDIFEGAEELGFTELLKII